MFDFEVGNQAYLKFDASDNVATDVPTSALALRCKCFLGKAEIFANDTNSRPDDVSGWLHLRAVTLEIQTQTYCVEFRTKYLDRLSKICKM